MRSSKSRSRSKSNRNRPSSGGNIVNRVFDSSGPEGKVRGTPQQIIDKYNQLARDAQLGNDRVATENFQQHAEHYLRMLSEAQREQDVRREEQERQNRERQAERDRERERAQQRQEREATPRANDPSEAPQPDVVQSAAPQPDAPQPDVLDLGPRDSESDSGLVGTPESKPKKTPAPRKPRTRKPASKPKDSGPKDSAAKDSEPTDGDPKDSGAKPEASSGETSGDTGESSTAAE